LSVTLYETVSAIAPYEGSIPTPIRPLSQENYQTKQGVRVGQTRVDTEILLALIYAFIYVCMQMNIIVCILGMNGGPSGHWFDLSWRVGEHCVR